MGLVKRKGTKAVKRLPNDFDENKTEFINRVVKVKNDHSYFKLGSDGMPTCAGWGLGYGDQGHKPGTAR